METKSKVENLFMHVKDYVEERIELVNLDVHDKASKTLSGFAFALIIALCATFVILFLSLALSWWIGRELGTPFLGFLIVGGVYLLITILIYVNREKWVRMPVTNAFLKNIANEED